LIGFAPLLTDDGKGERVIQLLRFAMWHPAIKSSDQTKAENLLKDLISEYPNNGIVADTETMEGMELSEVAKKILSIIPDG